MIEVLTLLPFVGGSEGFGSLHAQSIRPGQTWNDANGSAINAHGGTIKLYSESGKGTTFTVRLPLFQDHSNEQETVTDEIISSGKVEAVKVSEGSESGAKNN